MTWLLVNVVNMRECGIFPAPQCFVKETGPISVLQGEDIGLLPGLKFHEQEEATVEETL